VSLFVSSLLRPWPLGLLAVGLGLGAALGSLLAAGMGIVAAAAAAGAGTLDPTRRALHRLARTPGIDAATVSGIRATSERLRRLRARPGAGQEAYRALEQLDACHKGFLAFTDVLDSRFARGELTFGRYLEAGRQVYLAALDRIGNAATALEAVAPIDGARIRAELRQHERRTDANADGAEQRRGDALRDQVAALDIGLEDARARLADADLAIAELTAAAGALSRVETQRRLAAGESADSILELKALAERAHLYALPGSER